MPFDPLQVDPSILGPAIAPSPMTLVDAWQTPAWLVNGTAAQSARSRAFFVAPLAGQYTFYTSISTAGVLTGTWQQVGALRSAGSGVGGGSGPWSSFTAAIA